ncbi:hypothetical protein Hanom_Chr17g01547091 [Helianthus anomalus]
MNYIYFIREVVWFVIRNKYINYIYFSKTKSCHLVFEININYIYLYQKISYCLILERIAENNKRIENIISRFIL